MLFVKSKRIYMKSKWRVKKEEIKEEPEAGDESFTTIINTLLYFILQAFE